MSRLTRRAATALVAGVLVTTGAGAAYAGITGVASGGHKVTVASWGAKAAGTGGATSAPNLTWDNINGMLAAVRVFRVYNTGSVAFGKADWTFTVNRTANSGNNVPPTNFDVCTSGSFETTCAGFVTVGATTTTKFSVPVADVTQVPGVGGFLSMRAAPQSSNYNQGFTATVDISVSGSQIPDKTTNS